MKKVLLSGFVAFSSIAAFSQVSGLSGINQSIKADPAGESDYIDTPVQLNFLEKNIDKAENISYYVDYSALNTDDNFVPSGDGFYVQFRVSSQAQPIDSIRLNLGVALRPYWGFTDYADIVNTYYEADPTAANAIIRIDSLFAFFAHSNTSGNANKIIFSLTGGQNYTFQGIPPVQGPNNTVYWADTITTTTTLSPNGFADGTPAASGVEWSEAVGVELPLTANSGSFVIRCTTQDFDIADSLIVFGYLKDDGGASGIAPYVWGTTSVNSATPTNISLWYASAAMWAKVTYTNTLSIENLNNLGFAIHSFMPNPANASTTISYELKTPGDVDFLITDMSGKQVRMVSLKGQTVGTNNYELNTSDLAAGFYNVSMKVNNQVHTQKLSVVK